MRIAQVSPLYESVPPRLYGGTERVVSYLTEELVRLGHDVTLFASGDSVTAARLRSPCPTALRLDPHSLDSLAPHVRMLGWVYQQADQFDVIHCHTDYLGLPLTRGTRTPTGITLHGRLNIPDITPLYYDYPEVPLISISTAQRQPLPLAHWVATVPHGLPADLYTFQPKPGSYLLFLGRISPEKCPDAAIRIALQAEIPLRIAAKVDKVDQQYFETTIRPYLDHSLIEFLGEADEPCKRELLGHALALLFPIDWPEPFGLVMIESLACGTPVIARRRGSVPEVLEHGQTGFICETEDEMVAAVHQIATLDRVACRRAFEARFTARHMAQNYLQVYQRLIAAKAPAKLADTIPLRHRLPKQARSGTIPHG